MRRSKAVSAIALFAGAALVLGACSGGGGGEQAGSLDQQQNQDPGQISSQDEIFKRPANLKDAGPVTVAVEESHTDYNNLIGATNSQANLRVQSLQIPSPYIGVYEGGEIKSKIDGDLMESVKTTSTDPKQVVEYKFQKAAKWEDGAPIGCKDMYLRWLAGSTEKNAGSFDSSYTGYTDIEKIECSPDFKTATVTFKKPFADFRGLWSFTGNDGMMPAHILEKATGIQDITKVQPSDTAQLQKAAKFYTTEWLGNNPKYAISGGPYRIKSTDLRNTTVLERNPNYWGPKPGPSTITLRTNQNAQSAAQQLQNKELQVIDVQADAPTALQLREFPDVHTFAQGGQTYEHIDFQMSKPLFKDNPELRKAVAACVDRESILNNLIRDIDPKAKALGNVMFMPNEDGYEDHYQGVGKSGKAGTAEAKKLMEDGGWKLGGDGVYAKNGQKAQFSLGFKTVDRRNRTAQLVATSCKKAGIKITPAQSDAFNDDNLVNKRFDAALFAWVAGLSKASSTENYVTGGPANYNNYSNPKVDEQFNKANSNLNFQERIKQLNEADKLMKEDMHSIPLFQLTDYTAWDRGIGAADANGKVGPLSYVNFQGGATWNAFSWQKQQN